MKITWIGHACVLIQDCNVTLLVDPWLIGRSYLNHELKNSAHLDSLEMLKRIDFLLFSHPHEDHFHLDSIRLLRLYKKIDAKTAVIIPKYKFSSWKNRVRHLFGDAEIFEIEGKDVKLKHLSVSMFWASNQFDTSWLISNKDCGSVFLQTDAASYSEHTASILGCHRARVCFLLGGLTGPWPLYFDYNYTRRVELNREKQFSIQNTHIKILEALKPEIFALYANDQRPANLFGAVDYTGSLGAHEYQLVLREKYDRHSGGERLPTHAALRPGDFIDLSDTSMFVGSPAISEKSRNQLCAVEMFPKSTDYFIEKNVPSLGQSDKLAIEHFIRIFTASNAIVTFTFALSFAISNEIGSLFGFIRCSTESGNKSALWIPGNEYKDIESDLTVYVNISHFKSWVFGLFPMQFDTFNSGIALFVRSSEYQTREESAFLNLIKMLRFS